MSVPSPSPPPSPTSPPPSASDFSSEWKKAVSQKEGWDNALRDTMKEVQRYGEYLLATNRSSTEFAEMAAFTSCVGKSMLMSLTFTIAAGAGTFKVMKRWDTSGFRRTVVSGVLSVSLGSYVVGYTTRRCQNKLFQEREATFARKARALLRYRAPTHPLLEDFVGEPYTEKTLVPDPRRDKHDQVEVEGHNTE